MKDWSYTEAMVLAEERFNACVRTHYLIVSPGVACQCVCGWRGGNSYLWREHVDTACIVQQVRQNRRA